MALGVIQPLVMASQIILQKTGARIARVFIMIFAVMARSGIIIVPASGMVKTGTRLNAKPAVMFVLPAVMFVQMVLVLRQPHRLLQL